MESTVQQQQEVVDVRGLLEAGVHFGHQAKRWNPKMKRYIFAQRAGVHIIDLDQTLTLLGRALAFVRGVAEAGREVLFVGTKKQAQLTVAEQAVRSGQPYVVERYIGGMLTNFQTIQPRIEYFKALRQGIEATPEEERTGRDWFAREREYQKLRRNFAGITEMDRLPGAVVVIDPKREELIIKEANRLKIPVVALTDTNCDPDVVDYVIPGNDDAIRAINLITRLIADAIVEGRGGEEPINDDRPVPPAVEEARFAEDRASEPLSEAAKEGGLAEDQPTGLADPVESAGEIAPEEDPTTSYSGSESAEREEGTPGGPERGATPAPHDEPASNEEGEPEARAESEDEAPSEIPTEAPSETSAETSNEDEAPSEVSTEQQAVGDEEQ